jgi:RNA polymerase sigma-70 factor (ECF subfamily)
MVEPRAPDAVMTAAAMDQNLSPGQPADPSDADLLRRCAAADPGALGLLLERHGEALAGYLYRLLGNREDAEEAVADVFMRAWRAAGGFKGSASVRGWLYRIAYHLAIDRIRCRSPKPGKVLPFSELDAESVASMTDEPESVFFDAYQRDRDRLALRGALGQMEPRDRALLALHYLEGCSYEQIREITGYSLARVRSRLHRARQRLKRHFLALRDSDEAVETLAKRMDDSGWDPKRLPLF